jgi:2-keto-4-pentenoate hydratase/2-oxohepta-3-ene-1,7-dioic acid hydratase in catechol pathway
MRLVTFERRVRPGLPGEGRARLRRDADPGEAELGVEPLEGGPPGGCRLGALVSGPRGDVEIVDLNRALALRLASEDSGAPEAEADSLLPASALAFLRAGPSSLVAARSALEFVAASRDRFGAPDLRRAGGLWSRRDVMLRAPVPRPGKILGVARNYADHAAERGDAPPEEPVLFLKAPSASIGCDEEIVLPGVSRSVDFEGELAVVIGRVAREVELDQAMEHVAGYTCANDVTARDFQHVRGQRFIGKSCDTFAPLGPALVTLDELSDPHDLALRTVVSGEVLQSGRTKEMVFGVPALIAFASRLMTLEPGDVLLTGTPGGVGAARTPPRFLRPGDYVEVEIEGVGRLRNFVRSGRP